MVMEESQEKFTPEQSLELIGKFIMNYRKNLKDHSFSFLAWGWLTILASITHFTVISILLERKQYDMIGIASIINWTIFLIAGFTITMFHYSKQAEKQISGSHISGFIRTLWQVTGLAVLIEVFICMKIGNNFPSPFILATLGMSTLVTGSVIKFRPIVYGGLILFVFAIIESFVLNEYQLLLNGGAFLFGYIIPGYMLKASKSV
jgi:hypothetical protein